MTESGIAAPFRQTKLSPGLYFVSTPIGAARDITLRALDILASAEVLAAEDTRTLRHLMDLHGVPLAGRQILAYHDHNGAKQRPKLLAALADGKSVAYASEAGTPLVADPGYHLAREAAEAGHLVTAAPGPSAVLAALTIAGLPSDRFHFAGFAPTASGARKRFLAGLAGIDATLILFESPKRIGKLLTDLGEILGEDRQIAICRELTKKFEEVRRGSISELRNSIGEAGLKGEVVVLIDRAPATAADPAAVEAALRRVLGSMPVKQAATDVAAAFDLPRREVYQLALRLKDEI